MQTAQPGAARTTLQPLSQRDAYGEHIYPILYLEALRDQKALGRVHTKHCRQASAPAGEVNALWAGICALNQSAERHLSAAKADGKLLMCWEGSAVVDLAGAVA